MGKCCGKGSPEDRDGNQKGRRRKIWELDSRWHCPIVGTCLTVSDLNRLARKLGIRIENDARDYNLHVHFVGAIAERGPTAKLVQKLLNRRYRLTVNRSNHAHTPEALLVLWDDARAKGNISGPFWALVTHPEVGDEAGCRVFADIHMLSHLAGASNRADIGRLTNLEMQNAALEDAMLKKKRRFREALGKRETAIAKMEKRLAHVDARTLTRLKTRIRELENNKDADDLKRMVSEQGACLKDAYHRMNRLKTELTARSREATSLRAANDGLQRQGDDLRAQCAALENHLGALLAPNQCDSSACPAAGGEEDFNLCRRCIAFVGGRSRQAPHFRALVKRHNGEFLHHDGGLGESHGKLEAVLAKADLVFFPVDCISHGASTKIKRHCKRLQKPFVPLPTSSLSTFLTGLREATRQDPAFPKQ